MLFLRHFLFFDKISDIGLNFLRNLANSPVHMAFIGIFLITVGLTFILLAGVIEALVRLVIGGWILYHGINKLINTINIPKRNKIFIIYLLISMILIGIGLYTILESNLAFKTIGIILMAYSVVEITNYIFIKKDAYIKEEIIIEQKNSKVIEAKLIENKKKK